MVEFPDTLMQCHAGIGSRRTAFEKLPMKAVIDFFEKGEKNIQKIWFGQVISKS